jgi:hypothetical protein
MAQLVLENRKIGTAIKKIKKQTVVIMNKHFYSHLPFGVSCLPFCTHCVQTRRGGGRRSSQDEETGSGAAVVDDDLGDEVTLTRASSCMLL